MSDAVLRPAALRVPALTHASVWSRVTPVAIGVGIAAVGVLARAYELRDVPRLTDETDEVMRGWEIAQGQVLPLTNVDAYIGPLWNYLLALGFIIFGPSSLLPRIVTMLIAVLTVAATGWLGRELALRLGRPERVAALGFGAATLLATSSFHAIVSSRIAWSHALTPLMMTAAFGCLLRWERTRSGWALAGLGLAYGLAVHTHLTAVALAPALAIWALMHWRAVLLRRAGYVALGLFLLANAPLLAFNLLSGFGTVREAAQVGTAYAGGSGAFGTSYGQNALALLTSWPLLLAGNIGERRGEMLLALGDPFPFVYAALFLVGMATALRGRLLMAVLPFTSAALVLPMVNGKYEPLFNGRYLAPLLPLAFALIVLAVMTLFESRTHQTGRRQTVVAAAIVGLTVAPLWSLTSYVQSTVLVGPNNRELYRAAQIVKAAGSTKPVLIDATLSGTRLSSAREGTGILEYLLILDDRVTVRRYQPADLSLAVERGEGDLVVVSPRLQARLDKEVMIEDPPGEAEARRRRRSPFVVLRIAGSAGFPPATTPARSGTSRP